ncbi:dimethylsulfonioproprionate lyase family protein [Enterovibrio norvegicus]|nr:dimethylsulfonioproprionate lyase family protein [Enterovibrio norvegicus]
MDNNAEHLLRLIKTYLSHFDDEHIVRFRAALPDENHIKSLPLESHWLPVSEQIQHVGATAPQTSAIVSFIQMHANTFAWRQPYKTGQLPDEFLEGSAWFPIADRQGPFVFDQGLVEIMLLDRGVTYPRHHHEPEEMYLVLGGDVYWEANGMEGSPAWKRAGDCIYHPSHQPHQLQAGADPVLILSLWRGGGFEMPNIH